MFSYGIDVTVERPSGTDRYGNPLTPATHTLPGVGLAPAGSSEEIGDRSTVTWDVDLLSDDATADLRPSDVVVVPSGSVYAGRFEVHGRPARYLSPLTGWDAGMVARLKGVSG